MSNAIRSAVQGMSAYIPGEQPEDGGYIKLNQNENPYPPSPKALAAMQAELAKVGIYPESSNRVVREAAADAYGVSPDMVMAVNGSDEMLRILCQACAGEGDVVALFTPGFTFYKTLAAVQGANVLSIEFGPDFRLPPLPKMQDVKLVFLPSPHAPSGVEFTQEEVERLIQAAPSSALVVVDEAYADFGTWSAIPLLDKYPNLVIVRTLSKSYSMAGLRVGLGIAPARIMHHLDKVRDYYNLDRVAQVGAAAALRDQPYFRENVEKIKATRARLTAGLERLGAKPYPSATNFVLARFPDHDAEKLYRQLKDRKILVRYFSTPQIADCLRITVGTDAEIDALLAAMEPLMKKENV